MEAKSYQFLKIAAVRSCKPPEVYTGKGISYVYQKETGQKDLNKML